MQPGAHLETDSAHKGVDRRGTADRPRRAVEGGQEPIAGGIDLAALEALELLSNERVMPFEQVTPAPVAEPRRLLGRADDVGEEDGCEHAVRLGPSAGAGQELLDLVYDLVGVPRPERVGISGQLDEFRARNLGGDPAALFHVRVAVVGAMHDERRRLDGRQDVAHVELRVHPHQRGRRAGACAATEVHRQTLLEGLVLAGHELVEVHPLRPVALQVRDLPCAVVRLRRPGVIGAPAALREHAEEQQRRRSLRVGRCEENAHQAALGEAEDRRLPASNCIQHGSNVVHPLLERG